MKKYSFVFTIAVMLLSACSKYNTNLNELPTWNSDWLLPLVKGQVSFENIKELNDSKIVFDIPALDIGYANIGLANVPPLSIANVGPYKQALSSWLHLVNFDSLQIQLTFTNRFPITIGAGTKFSFRRTADPKDPSNLIYQHALPQDLAPAETYSFDVIVNNNFLSDTLFQFLEQFSSPGANNVYFAGNKSELKVDVKIIDINRVELHAGKSLVEKDTVEIDFSKEETGTDTASHALVNFFVENALPVNFGIQIYFLDPVNSTITDSLLNTPLNILGCNTNAAGDPTGSIDAKTSISINTARISEIKKSRKAIISYKLNTLGYPPPYVVLSDKTYLKLQITGDLHLAFNLNSL
jgi:hypothetical protein